MVRVEWVDRAVTLAAPAGERLLDIVDQYPHLVTVFSCRSGHCGTCRVEVVEGLDCVSAATDGERETLDEMGDVGARGSIRLACQLRVVHDDGLVRLRSLSDR